MMKVDGASTVLKLPARHRITRRHIPHVDRDHGRGWDIAGPLFKAGATIIALSESPKYEGTLYVPDNHWIGLVVQGKMKFQCGTKTFIAHRGDLVFTPAGMKLQRTGLGPIRWLYIVLEDIPMWKPLKDSGPYVRKYESADLMYILACRIIGALRTQDTYSMYSARESATTLVTLLKREFRQADNAWQSKYMHRYVEILDRIRARPDKKWNRRTLASALNTSERNLTRAFKKIFNMPPSAMVTSIRMDIASRLLINTDKKLSHIARSVGYESHFSFSRLFKKHVGVSPDRYRTMPPSERQKPNEY